MSDAPVKAADPRSATVPAAAPSPATASAASPAAVRRPRTEMAAPRQLSPSEELETLIRARYPIIYVVSWEEERVERCLREIADRREKSLFVWTITEGIVKSGTAPQRAKAGGGSTADPLAALDAVIQQVGPAIYLFKDFHPFMADERCNLSVVRRLRDAA